MMNKPLIFTLFCCLLLTISVFAISAQTPSETPNNQSQRIDAQVQKLKNQIEKIGRGNDVTIITTDGKRHYGSILNIEDDLVFINDVDRNETVEIKYRTIQKVRKNYGVNRDLNGNRIAPRKNLFGILIASAAILIPIIILAASKD